jgi:drug/metabolite transporter (DMT)-like permease
VIAAGIAVALAASVANAFAVVFQAGEDRRSPVSQAGRFSLLRLLLRRRRWLIGTMLMIVAWPLQILALGLAPITVVQPTLAASPLVLLAVARVKLGERVGAFETFGALCIVCGVTAVIVASPHDTVLHPAAARVAVPLVLVGGAALVAYLIGRLQPRRLLAPVIGAGLAYAWVDFVNKLLADNISTGQWGLAVIWLAATIAFGALAFLEETTALQRRPAVTVSPVVGAVQDPLPVLMALAAGVEVWGSATHNVVALALGLLLVTIGAAVLGRSKAVTRVSGDPPPASGNRHRLGVCGPDRRPRPPAEGVRA